MLKVYKIHPDAVVPERKSAEAAAFDLCTIEDFSLRPMERIVVGTGLAVQPPPGMHTEIIIRSGIGFKYNITLINSVGLIDRDYAGPEDELKLMLYRFPIFNYKFLDNVDDIVNLADSVTFNKGDRVAQLIVRSTYVPKVELVHVAPGANRGGLGSTGK